MNKNFNKARCNKDDEYYTQIQDIEDEVKHYKNIFKGKSVLCNCDDPKISNFFHYFSHQYEHLNLTGLVTTCFKNTQYDLFTDQSEEQAIYLEYYGDKNGNRVPDVNEIGVKPFKGDGDFRSPECIKLLEQADIVCTNSPFSLFNEFLALLIKYDKKFLIIGPAAAIIYQEIFPLIRDNKIWYGVSPRGMNFKRPNGEFKNINACWYTNLPHDKQNDELILTKTYKGNENNYPKYDKYNAINIDNVKDIPSDYNNIMGVPITFLDNYNPNQFEIIGLISSARYNKDIVGIPFLSKGDARAIVNNKVKYSRFLIRRK